MHFYNRTRSHSSPHCPFSSPCLHCSSLRSSQTLLLLSRAGPFRVEIPHTREIVCCWPLSMAHFPWSRWSLDRAIFSSDDMILFVVKEYFPLRLFCTFSSSTWSLPLGDLVRDFKIIIVWSHWSFCYLQSIYEPSKDFLHLFCIFKFLFLAFDFVLLAVLSLLTFLMYACYWLFHLRL